MKCWLRAGNEPPAGNVYAEWVKSQNESYRVAETNRLIAQMPPPGSAHSPPAETLKLAKWLLASEVVVRATGISRGSRSEKAPSPPSPPSQPGIDAGSGGLGNRTPVPSSARGTPDSTLETSPAHLGTAPQPAESPPTCLLETCLHLVERVPAEGRGKAAQFVPIRFIFFNKLSKDDKLLLAYNALVLGQVLGRDIAVGKVIHGDDHATLKVKTSALAGEVRKRLEKIAALLSSSAPPDLVLNRHCAECEFHDRCRMIAVEKDDLSLLATMSAKERQKLRSKGIFTVTQLSYTFRPRRRPKRLRDKREKYHHSLKALAIREKKIHIVGTPELKIEGTPVYLDVEGLPDRDFYYLIGLRIGNGDSAVQHSLWANTVEDEGRIWQEFLAILETVEKPVLIHYGSYEKVFLKRMSELHGTPPENSGSSRALASAVNFLSFLFAQIYFPTFSNGLKETAGWLGFRWSEPGSSGLRAVMWHDIWARDMSLAGRLKLISYNAEDCHALEILAGCLKFPSTPAASGEIEPKQVRIDTGRPFEGKWGNFSTPIAEFQEINKAARWDYQRDRVFVRTNDRIRKLSKQSSPKGRNPVRVNRVIVCPEDPMCPQCGSASHPQSKLLSRVLHDLFIGKSSIRRRVVEYRYRRYFCAKCHAKFGMPAEFWARNAWGSKYGRNLIAFLLYHSIELAIPQRKTARSIRRLFGVDLKPCFLARIKNEVGGFYSQTRQMILERISRGNLAHVDETHANIEGMLGYVWVFTSLQEVAYLYSDSREGEIAKRVLAGFGGVLVTDFFSAYDSFECPQQKCLLHLIRDLNDEVLEFPFDEELKQMVMNFAQLLKPMVETVDRHGLKKHFLRRHLGEVKRFYRRFDEREWTSEAALRCRDRFLKNRTKLFTFLQHDGIPWNNNNAEHAIRAFAAIRDVVGGSSTAKSIDNALILLSVCQTCKYMGVDFLDFLRSGERDIYAFAENRRRCRRRSPAEHPQVPLVHTSANQ
jgi:predicted RecB family nuclease